MTKEQSFLRDIKHKYLKEYCSVEVIASSYPQFKPEEIRFLLQTNGVKLRTAGEAVRALKIWREKRLDQEMKPTKKQMETLLAKYHNIPTVHRIHFAPQRIPLSTAKRWFQEYGLLTPGSRRKKFQTVEEKTQDLLRKL